MVQISAHRHYCHIRRTEPLEIPGRCWGRNQVSSQGPYSALTLGSCLLAERGSILRRRQRMADVYLVTVISLWRSENGHEVRLWGSPPRWECRPAPGHRLKRVWSTPRGEEELQPALPFTRVQKCGSRVHGWGRQLLLLRWGLHGHQGCQEHHPSPSHICSVFFHHKPKPDNSESCLYCVLRLLAGKKILKGLSYYSHEQTSWWDSWSCSSLLKSYTSESVI